MDVAGLVRVLEEGGVVACPTETLLGLLADARNPDAVERVAALKGRPANMPIALLIPGPDAISEVARAPSEKAVRLMAAHWPGPLTLLLQARGDLDPRLARDGKVGVRVPGPSPAAALVRAFGHALTATSANRTGEPPVASVEELSPSIREGVDGAVMGSSPGGPPSTLIDATTDPMIVLRPGAIEVDPAAL